MPKKQERALERYAMEDDPFPTGFVPKFQPSSSTDQRLFGYREEYPAVQVKFHRSTWFKNHSCDDIISPTQTVILTSMEHNDHLLGRTPEDEFDRLVELEDDVDVYFPGDRWTCDYDTMSRRAILKEINRSVQGQLALKRMVDEADLDVTLYPIILGWERWHYEHCRILLEEFETRSVAFDATQYGNAKNDLYDHLETLVDTLNPERIYLNGRVSADHLRDVPREVVAFSGKSSILDNIRLPHGRHSRALLNDEVEKRVAALNNVQTDLKQFFPEYIAGD